MDIRVEDVAKLIGFKEIEMFQLREELARTRQVLEQVTRAGVQDGGETPQEADSGTPTPDSAGDER